MLARFRSLNIADRRDVLLFTVVGLALFVFSIVWALFLAQIEIPIIGQNLFLTLVVIVAALVVAIVPRGAWGRNETKPRARFAVRFGLGLQIFGLVITPVGLYYETLPAISVPVGFASFLAIFFGVFIAGFGGNALAPDRA
jgi:FtsH-binding integral membrane protein